MNRPISPSALQASQDAHDLDSINIFNLYSYPKIIFIVLQILINGKRKKAIQEYYNNAYILKNLLNQKVFNDEELIEANEKAFYAGVKWARLNKYKFRNPSHFVSDNHKDIS